MPVEGIGNGFDFLTKDLIERKGFDSETYGTDICPDDEMFYKAILPGYNNNQGLALFKYIESGFRIFDIYKQLVAHLGDFSAIGPVLDFGSGCGRLTRSLIHLLPKSQIWVSDLYPYALTWQAESFGVNALASVRNPDHFALEQEHTIILAGSVFSHLPDAIFRRWLSRLIRIVAPRGMLAISVHAENLLPAGETIGEGGFRYLGWSESESHEADVYGMMYVTEDYMAKVVAECDPSRKLSYRRYPKALYENQDLYVIAGDEVDLSALDLTITPIGGTDRIRQKGDVIECIGWGIDLNPGHQLVRAEVYYNDEHVSTEVPVADNVAALTYFPGAPNTPVSWVVEVPIEQAASGVLRVDLVSSSGAIAHCYAAMLGSTDPDMIRRT